MKQKLFNNKIIKLKNSLTNDKNKLIDKNLLEFYQAKILKMIHDLSFEKESEYRELFFFEDDEDFKKLEKKFIFILLKMFQNNIVDKIDQNLKIFINPIYENTKKYINNKEKNSFFYSHIKIIIVFEDYLVKEFTTIFFWVNKLLLEDYKNFKKFNIIDVVINRMSQISHTMFLKIENVKKYHFFDYLQNVVETLSSKFKIIKNNQTDYEDLLSDSKILIKINYDNISIIEIEFSEKQTKIKKLISENQNHIEKSFLVEKMPKNKNVQKIIIVETWRKVVQNLRQNFKNFWTKEDNLYLLIRTIKHLFSLINSEIKENDFKINLNKKINEKFLKICEIEKFNCKIEDGQNLSWKFNAFYFQEQKDSLNCQNIKILTKNNIIIQKMINNLKTIKYDSKNNILNRIYIKNRINSVINGYFYDFKTNFIYKRTKTICEISIENILIGSFVMDWSIKKVDWQPIQKNI